MLLLLSRKFERFWNAKVCFDFLVVFNLNNKKILGQALSRPSHLSHSHLLSNTPCNSAFAVALALIMKPTTAFDGAPSAPNSASGKA